MALVPDRLDAEGRQIDRWGEDAEPIAEHLRDPLADGQDDVVWPKDGGAGREWGDLERDPPAPPTLCERRVNDAARPAARSDERMRQRHECLERQALPDFRMVRAHDANEALVEDPL